MSETTVTTRRAARRAEQAAAEPSNELTPARRRRDRRRAAGRFVGIALSALIVAATAYDVAGVFLAQRTLQLAADTAVAELAVPQPAIRLHEAAAEAREHAKAIALERVAIDDSELRTGSRSCSAEPGTQRGAAAASLTHSYPLLFGVTNLTLTASAHRPC